MEGHKFMVSSKQAGLGGRRLLAALQVELVHLLADVVAQLHRTSADRLLEGRHRLTYSMLNLLGI